MSKFETILEIRHSLQSDFFCNVYSLDVLIVVSELVEVLWDLARIPGNAVEKPTYTSIILGSNSIVSPFHCFAPEWKIRFYCIRCDTNIIIEGRLFIIHL
jgi:hypothetical protein